MRSSRTLMMKAAESLSWSDLPSELLGLVLERLPSLADRVRLRAVCQPWRSNARLQSPSPPLPWLSLLDGTFLSIPDGKVIRMALPDNAHCYGSIDNWLFLMQIDGGCSLMNPFSKATLDLPKLAAVWCRDWLNSDNRFTTLFYKLFVFASRQLLPTCLEEGACNRLGPCLTSHSSMGSYMELLLG
ncbi:probable F-box protein At4g22060 isoform X3 [Panicum virgatum]|uniref:probable F-box protein At4g22060 isoform X3 n=1 Tax=Panicum virgatum TaxID=38727 RepID=UPI0019D5DA6A|nr:probable F-box protein At4g22060 isoform X3 [Panicum virgatum]